MCFNDVMTQGKSHFGCQRMHNVFHAFGTLFFYYATTVANEHG